MTYHDKQLASVHVMGSQGSISGTLGESHKATFTIGISIFLNIVFFAHALDVTNVWCKKASNG